MWGWAAAIAIGVIVLLWVAIRQLRRWLAAHRARVMLEEARDAFHRRREWLEVEFISRASKSGKPRDMVWAGNEFDDQVTYARDRRSGQLRALVSVTVSFEAEDTLPSDKVDAVVAVRMATAVFRFEDGRWTSDGRAIFNLTPAETLSRFQHELEVVE